MIRPGLVLSFGDDIAVQAGQFRAELAIARVTLKTLLSSLDGQWQAEEVRGLVERIDRALAAAKEQP